jgi:tripartite-type tricarboxylate transporter receptor subunit TctC
MMNRRMSYFLIALALTFGTSTVALGAEFYKGKTIHFIVGFSPGGGYDQYTRVIARHMARHIPGNPTSVVQNRTGAGSLIAGNYVYNKAKPDGLTIGIWNNQTILFQALGDKKVKLDGRKIGWIGAPGRASGVCAIMGFTGLKTLKEIINSKRSIKMGATRGGNTTDLPRFMNRTLGTKFKLIQGYRGTAGLRLAMQSREVEGACWTWDSMRTTARSMLKAKGDDKLIPFIIHSRWDDPEVRDLPLFPEVIKDKNDLIAYNVWSTPYGFQRPFALPPGVPRERLSILRKAFKATLKDPQFLADAKKSRLTIEYVSGEEIEKFVEQILSMPPNIREFLRVLTGLKKKKK